MLYYNNGHTQKLGYVGRLVVWVTLGKIDENNLGKGRVKKKSDIYHLGGGQRGSIITFYFFFPNALKIISRHLSFFKYRGRGGVPWGLGGGCHLARSGRHFVQNDRHL